MTSQFLNRLKRSKKLTFIEQNFSKIRPDPNLRKNILSLASVLHLFIKVIRRKKTMEPVETFVFLPYSKYKAMDNRAKKSEPNEMMPLEEMENPSVNNQNHAESPSTSKVEEPKSHLGKEVTKSYRMVQIKKLLQHIETRLKGL